MTTSVQSLGKHKKKKTIRIFTLVFLIMFLVAVFTQQTWKKACDSFWESDS